MHTSRNGQPRPQVVDEIERRYAQQRAKDELVRHNIGRMCRGWTR